MSCLGCLSIVTKEQVNRLREIPREERAVYLDEVLMSGESCDLAQSWDAMHRTLTNGKLEFGNDNVPGCWVILGGEVLYGDGKNEHHIIVSKSPEQVKQAAQWLTAITEDNFKKRYYSIDAEEYGMELDEDDFEFTYEYFCEVLEFWKMAAKQGLFVMFDASQ